jgi:hypothetical protein
MGCVGSPCSSYRRTLPRLSCDMGCHGYPCSQYCSILPPIALNPQDLLSQVLYFNTYGYISFHAGHHPSPHLCHWRHPSFLPFSPSRSPWIDAVTTQALSIFVSATLTHSLARLDAGHRSAAIPLFVCATLPHLLPHLALTRFTAQDLPLLSYSSYFHFYGYISFDAQAPSFGLCHTHPPSPPSRLDAVHRSGSTSGITIIVFQLLRLHLA